MAEKYEVFGLTVRSEIPLPELQSIREDVEPDVTVRLGSLAADEAESAFRADGDMLRFDILNVGRFQISGGREIVIDVMDGAIGKNVRVYLLGSAFGAILHQRGLLPLHANAIEIEDRAVAIAGQSGAGKSTLAGWFEDQGVRVISDDVCVIGFTEVGPFTMAGVRRLRLRPDAILGRGLEPSAYPHSYSGDPDFDKFDIPLRTEFARGARLPIAAVYVLATGDGPRITPITGVAAVEEAFSHTYRGGFVPLLGLVEAHWQACVRLISEIPFFRFTRRWDLSELENQNRHILEHASALIGSA